MITSFLRRIRVCVIVLTSLNAEGLNELEGVLTQVVDFHRKRKAYIPAPKSEPVTKVFGTLNPPVTRPSFAIYDEDDCCESRTLQKGT